MKISDAILRQIDTKGFATVPNFIEGRTLAEAQAGLWKQFPRPEEYFAAPASFPRYATSQIGGMDCFPYRSDALNRLSIHHDLVNAAERYLGSDDLHLYKIELWAKYGGAINYDQPHHRDYVNHSLTVPSHDPSHRQLTTFLFLSDVTEADGPTCLVPLERTRTLPFSPAILAKGQMHEHEEKITVKAGTLLLYRTDVLHRGTNLLPGRARFALLVDFQHKGNDWAGKIAWPDRAVDPMWAPTFAAMTPKERSLFGFPAPGHPFWTEQTIRDTAARYPGMDCAPYRQALPGYRAKSFTIVSNRDRIAEEQEL